MSGQVHEYADQLRQYATHFVQADWCYTRDLGDLRHIRFGRDFRGYNNPLRRVRRWLGSFSPRRDDLREALGMGRWWNWRHPIINARVMLRTDRNLPDGVLDGGGVLVFWEETGEYLQYVQPSVGALLADLMDAHPDLPEVQAIAVEMKRINDDYGARVADTVMRGAS